MNNQIFRVHNGMNIELLKLKVINNEPLLFPQRFIDNGDPLPVTGESNIFEVIFKKVQNDNQFYISLFKNYKRYLINVNETINYAIDNDNKSAFQVLVEHYQHYDIHVIFSSILYRAINQNSFEIIQHLLTSDHFKIGIIENCNGINDLTNSFFSNGKCESRFVDDNLYKSCKILNYLIESNKFQVPLNKISNQSLKERFKEYIPQLSLKYLIESCKSIILLKIKQDTNTSELTMEELMEINNKFTNEQLNSIVISLPNSSWSSTVLKRLCKFYYFVNFGSNDFNCIFYYLKFEDDQFDYSKYTYGGNVFSFHRFNHGCSFGSWRYLKFINLPYNEKQLSFAHNEQDCLFKYCNSRDTIDQMKRIEFLNQVLIQNLIDPITLVQLLIRYGDIELLEKAISIINRDGTSILKSKFIINNYITTTSMLNYCWLNFNNAMVFDIENTLFWFKIGRLDLVKCFESLSNIKYTFNQVIPVDGDRNYYSLNYIRCLLYIIERENQLKTFNYDPDTVLKVVTTTMPSGIPFLKLIILALDQYNGKDGSGEESNQYRYNPLLLFNTPNSINYNDYRVDFINWVFKSNRQDHINTGKCSFTYIPKWFNFGYGQTKNLKSLYYIALYQTGRIDQMLKGIDFIGSIDLIDIFILVTQKYDMSTFDKLMNLFNNCNGSIGGKEIEKVKKERILLVLENATFNCDIRVFQHIFTNYKGYLKEKGTNNNGTSTIVEDEFYNSIFKEVLIADHILLYDFLFKYLNYSCITKFTIDESEQYNSVIYHNYFKHSSSTSSSKL